MKTKNTVLLICGVLISFIGSAQVPLQEVPVLEPDPYQYYYNTTRTFNENGYTYQSDKAEWGLVTLYNKANQYTYAHYERKDGNPIGNLESLFPLIEPDNWTRQKCFSIVNKAFSAEEKKRIKGKKLDVSMIVDSSTGKVIEVNFNFYYSTPLGTILVSTYRNLELALKDQIWFTPSDNGRKLNFIMVGWMHEIE